MNERLSRMERYSRKQHDREAVREDEIQLGRSEAQIRLRRSEVHRQQTGRERVAASAETGSGPEITSAEMVAQEEISALDMPSRREVYPSHRIKWTKWFYNSLLFIFIALMVLLFFWGMQQSTWGKQH
ncbi:hypothetical protein EJP77_03725 [Paenibacillus zeisoli]|uniref:Uncharacterized protein n=1 Tax=Paenibacillus zeisoli TaxID=2496267 RepID=A0A433XPW9_9BACL|nr:hypothetical protein [Paenibacillus zeisoli]RUT36109.1 hypothetical protein EJP77_03725 [Paenibacillus zeisoli]